MVIDISQWQGGIDWAAVKASGITRGIAKATEGVGFTDPNFHTNWAEMAAAGMPRGAYHFARPDAGNDPTAEADWFLSVVNPSPDDWLALDYEVVGGGAVWNLAFLGRIKARTGITSLFYSNYVGVSRVVLGGAALAAYPLWLAYPGSPSSPPPCPAPWSHISLYQFGTGSITGISGRVDEDAPLSVFGESSNQLTGNLQIGAVVISQDSINLFGRGADKALWQVRFDGTAWADRVRIGGVLGSPAISATRRANGDIHVIISGQDGTAPFFDTYEVVSTNDGLTWGPFNKLGGVSGFFVDSIVAVGSAPAQAQPIDLTAIGQAASDAKNAALSALGGATSAAQAANDAKTAAQAAQTATQAAQAAVARIETATVAAGKALEGA